MTDVAEGQSRLGRASCGSSHVRNAPLATKHPALSVEIEHALVAALRPEARRRDVSVARLALDLLGTIAADGLVTAVLDDSPPLPASWAPTHYQSIRMIGLTDEQPRTVMELAAPIPVEQRDEFLRVLAGELEHRGDVGPGELHRLCIEARRGAASCPGPRLW